MGRSSSTGFLDTTSARVAVVAVVILAVVVPTRALAGAHSAGSQRVLIKGYAFRPPSLSIRAGDAVTWLFEDGSTAHNVVGRGFRGSGVQKRGSFTVRFSRRGSFRYVCSLHPWMIGHIAVR